MTAAPFTVETLDTWGRVLVATRDIAPWELVLEDTCIATVPNDVPVCLGCLSQLDPDTCVPCPGCAWPMCGAEDCCAGPEHARECGVLARGGVAPVLGSAASPAWLYSAVAILRLLLLKRADAARWRQVEQLMDHWEERAREPATVAALDIIHALLTRRLGLDWVTAAEVRHVHGALQTNAVSLVSAAGRGCYATVSLLSHSCVPNLEPAADPGRVMRLRAKRRISRGEQLTMRYTHFLQPAWRVQSVLRSEWMFSCSCERCSDPAQADMGTHMSSFSCGCGGFYTTRLGESDTFRCSKCGGERDFTEKLEKMSTIERNINSSNYNDTSQLDHLCSQLENDEHVHEMFYLNVKVLMKYVDLFQDSRDKAVLEKVEARTKPILKLIREMDPGCSKMTGKYLLVLASTQERLLGLSRAERRLEATELKQEAKEMEAKELKQAVADIFKTKMIANKMLSQHFVRK